MWGCGQACASGCVCVACWGLQAPRQVSISPIITSQSPTSLAPVLSLSPRASQYRAGERVVIIPKLVSCLLLLAGDLSKRAKTLIYTLCPAPIHPSCILFYPCSSLKPCLTFISSLLSLASPRSSLLQSPISFFSFCFYMSLLSLGPISPFWRVMKAI